MILLVTCPFPDEASASAAARAVLEAQLAACCQAGPAIRSFYRWKGQLEEAVEIPLTCKTTGACWPELLAFLKQRHPYEVPEIVAVQAAGVLPEYAAWVEENCRPGSGGGESC